MKITIEYNVETEQDELSAVYAIRATSVYYALSKIQELAENPENTQQTLSEIIMLCKQARML